ncbi:hypothetical protein HYX09_02395 [Candidatus Woesearchaeota archaeon]|nr:hypothetical protein [Candidatus Woesearchaeota archaeon]
MIQNSFVLLERISAKLEKSIWRQGIRDWDDFANAKKIRGISNARKLYYERRLKEAKKELYSLNSSYFIDLLPSSETWRLYDFFRDSAVFLDIETTGIYEGDSLVMIGLYDGLATKTMLRSSFDFQYLLTG